MKFEFELTREDCEEAYRVNLRHHHVQKNNPFRSVSMAGYAAVAIGVLLLATPLGSRGWVAPMILIALGLFVPIRLTLIGLAQANAQWNASEHLLQWQTLEIDERALRKTSALSESVIQWETFTRWIEDRHMILLYDTPHRYQILIPKRVITSEAALVELRKLLREKLAPKTRAFPVQPLA